MMEGSSVRHGALGAAAEDGQDSLGDILYVRSSLLHVRVVHGREHHGKVVAGGGHRVLRVDLLGLNHIVDGIQVIQIIQHHLMDLKDSGAGLSHFLDRLGVESFQLLNCLRFRVLKSLDLRSCICDAVALYLLLAFLIYKNFSDGNAAKYALALICLHDYRPPYGLLKEGSSKCLSQLPSRCRLLRAAHPSRGLWLIKD